MSDRIKSSDIIEDELFVNVSKNTEAFIKHLNLVEFGLKSILTEAQKVMATTIFANSENIERYTKAVVEASSAQKILTQVTAEKQKALIIEERQQQESIKTQAALNKRLQEEQKLKQQSEKTTQAAIKTEKEFQKALDQENKTRINANKESERSEKQKQKEAKAQADLRSEYKKASDELRIMERKLLDAKVAGKEGEVENILLARSYQELKDKIVPAENELGKFGRDVGNYALKNKQFSGSFSTLSNSVNQLTREFPAFTYSVQTGFLALSNNIPIFFDEITKARKALDEMRASGEKTPSLFKTLASSIFSWGTVLSVAITLLTVYAKEIASFTAGLFVMNKGFEVSTEVQTNFYKTTTELLEKRIDAQLRLNVLQGKMTEDEAKIFDKNYAKRKKQLELESALLKERQEIAKYFNVPLNEVTGNQPDLNSPNASEAVRKLGFDKVAENGALNIAARNAQAKFNYEMQLLEQANQTEVNVITTEGRIKREKEAETDRKKALKDIKKAHDEELEEYRAYELKYYLEQKKAIEEHKKFIEMWRESEENRDKYNRDSNITWYDKENGITLDDHNAQVAMQEDFRKKKEEQQKSDQQRRSKEAREEFDLTLSFLDQLNRIKSDKIDKQLSNDIDRYQRNIIQQQQLAAQGLDNTLAFEKDALAKAELQRQQEAKKRERDAKTLAFLKLIGSFADKGDDQAVTKAFLQMAIATAISGSFAEGVEGLEGPGTETSDSILARLSKNESVITAKGTSANPGLPTAMNKGKVDEYFEKEYLPKYLVSHDVGSFAENTINSLMLQQFTTMNKKINSIEKALKERPVSQVSMNNMGEVIDTKIINGLRKVTTHKNTNNLI